MQLDHKTLPYPKVLHRGGVLFSYLCMTCECIKCKKTDKGFMVKNELWREVIKKGGYEEDVVLCRTCFEGLLGRKLKYSDLKEKILPINYPLLREFSKDLTADTKEDLIKRIKEERQFWKIHNTRLLDSPRLLPQIQKNERLIKELDELLKEIE